MPGGLSQNRIYVKKPSCVQVLSDLHTFSSFRPHDAVQRLAVPEDDKCTVYMRALFLPDEAQINAEERS
jgi:hypothetical protein